MTGIRSSFVLLAMLASQAIGSAQATMSPAAPNRRPIVVAVDQTTPQPAGDAAVRQRAEDLATQATGRFSEILSEDKAPPGDAAPSDEVFAPLWGWLSRASSDYRDVIVAKLKNPSGEIVVIAPPGGTQLAQATEPPAAPRTEPEPQRGLNWATIVEGIRYWLAQTNSSYRTEIVKKLARSPTPEGTGVAEGNTPATPPEAQSPPATRRHDPASRGRAGAPAHDRNGAYGEPGSAARSRGQPGSRRRARAATHGRRRRAGDRGRRGQETGPRRSSACPRPRTASAGPPRKGGLRKRRRSARPRLRKRRPSARPRLPSPKPMRKRRRTGPKRSAAPRRRQSARPKPSAVPRKRKQSARRKPSVPRKRPKPSARRPREAEAPSAAPRKARGRAQGRSQA